MANRATKVGRMECQLQSVISRIIIDSFSFGEKVPEGEGRFLLSGDRSRDPALDKPLSHPTCALASSFATVVIPRIIITLSPVSAPGFSRVPFPTPDHHCEGRVLRSRFQDSRGAVGARDGFVEWKEGWWCPVYKRVG
ncbi:hypothetical protein AVEN_144068-1 [Araneus ventricosus]|uniref:Uncharacterized protein n=1 Tax=Araneus ventricosus TaxID=182803 RepID=A0A4Y2DGX6_ARAVE|nr:hypothetical protein AVEN_144068-1 [Araneus ventricosus]